MAVAVKAIRISSIPHLSILCHEPVWQEANVKLVCQFKKDMQDMLYELYQYYKMRVKSTRMEQHEAIELLWMTTPVVNQPYKANISLHIIIRVSNHDMSTAQGILDTMFKMCTETIQRDRYSCDFCNVEEIKELWKVVNRNHARAITKTERIDGINTTMLKSCYSYDVIKETNADLGRLVNTLIQNPNSAVSMQLMPAFYTPQETLELSAKSQTLATLVNGVSINGVGNVQVESAKRSAETYAYYSENSNRPLFIFNLVIYSEERQAQEIASKLMGQLNAGHADSASFDAFPVAGVDPLADFEVFPWSVYQWADKNARDYNIWNSGQVQPVVKRLPFIITAQEASEFFRLPIGNEDIGAGLIVNETGSTSKSYAKGLLNVCDLPFGKLKSSPAGDEIGLRLIDLAKHMLIVGTPGSGKTNFSVGLLRKLWMDYKVPFLVIEPAKNEYRALIQNIPDLQVFTPGKNSISPFVFNPFVPPEGVRLESYKSTLKTAFAAGVTMTSPLDKIFEDTIDNCYSKFRWLNSYTKDDGGKIFNITDFVKCFEQTFNEIGYSGDAKNIGRAGLVRLQGLVKLFDNYFSIPIKDLLEKPTVIELAAIENSDEKALYIALILLSVLSYVNANYVGEGDQLKNFILVEEAHVLLDSSSHGGEGAANPAAIAQGLVKRMLAEIRSYGVSVAIADQSPRKVGIDIVALTDIKLGFRLVESEDREIFANSVSMSDRQMSRMAKLKPGEAYLFFNKMNEPEEIVTPEHRNSHGYRISLSDQELSERSRYWKLHPKNLRPYPECENKKECAETCDYNCRMLAREIGVRIAKRYTSKKVSYEEAYNHLLENFKTILPKELPAEQNTPKLRACAYMHAVRNLRQYLK